jgi:O-acetylserine/cysteine efflux transporter
MKPADFASMVAVILLWGFNFPLAKLGLSEVPPLLFMTLRFIIVAGLLCPFVRLPRDKVGGVMILAVLLGGLHFGLMFNGLARMDASTSALLSQTSVPFAALLAALVYRERLGWRRTGGMVLAFVGVGFIAGEPRFGSDPVPLLLVLAAAFMWALANIQIRRIGSVDGLALTAWLACFSAPLLLIQSAVIEHGQWHAFVAAGWRGWTGILYGAIAVAILSYGLWYPLVRRYPVNVVMPFTLLCPIIAVAASALMLGERLSWMTALGGAATVVGVAIVVLQRLPSFARMGFPRPRRT